ncbi:MAG: MarR family transcriptional regulator [Clostridia bacterium]|nr:MarR family transcriptional regulator [Clostridia bacterium]
MQNDSGQRPTSLELLIRVGRTHKRVVERQISELGIHGSQHHVLMALSHLGQFPTQNELARRMDVSPASAATMLKRLEGGGYIERRARSSDGRCNEVILTEKGNRVIDQSVRIFESVDRRMYEGIGDDERAQLRASLGKLLDNLRGIEEEMGGGQDEAAQSIEEGNETRP